MHNTIEKRIEIAHNNSRIKGFYELPEGILSKMRDNSLFTEEEVKAVKDAFISQRLMLITSELGEALEANRKDRYARRTARENMTTEQFEDYIKDSFEDELADASIRIFDLAGWLGIDLAGHIELKSDYNSYRPHLHNKKY